MYLSDILLLIGIKKQSCKQPLGIWLALVSHHLYRPHSGCIIIKSSIMALEYPYPIFSSVFLAPPILQHRFQSFYIYHSRKRMRYHGVPTVQLNCSICLAGLNNIKLSRFTVVQSSLCPEREEHRLNCYAISKSRILVINLVSKRLRSVSSTQ